jgi:hypothetical protein
VFTSGFRRSVRCVLLLFLVCSANVVRADEADDLAAAVVAHIRERLPAGAPPLAPADEMRVISFSHYIQRRFYFPTNAHDMQAAAIAAIDATESADPTTDASVLAQVAISGMVESLGHGARFLTTLGTTAPAAGEGDPAAPSSRQVGSLMLVSLPNMNVADNKTAHSCADFVRYFNGQTDGRITGVVLDLRGNEGGPLTDSSCLAGLFFKKGTLLFEEMSKQGELVKYESKPGAHIDLPVAVLIDNRTDNGGLLVAAVLQGQRRAKVIGELKSNVNGAVSSLVFPSGVNRALVLPTGEILLPGKHPLASEVHVDVSMPANDEAALLSAARESLAQQRQQ